MALDGTVVQIDAPLELNLDVATITATVDFGSEVLEFTAGGDGLGEFFSNEIARGLRPSSRTAGHGTLSLGKTDAGGSAALWQGDHYVVSTTSGSLGEQQLESLLGGVRFEERDAGVVLESETATFDRSDSITLHQPVSNLGALEIRRRPDPRAGSPEGRGEPVAGGLLYSEADGSLLLATETALARLTVESASGQAEARRIMSQMKVSWTN